MRKIDNRENIIKTSMVKLDVEVGVRVELGKNIRNSGH